MSGRISGVPEEEHLRPERILCAVMRPWGRHNGRKRRDGGGGSEEARMTHGQNARDIEVPAVRGEGKGKEGRKRRGEVPRRTTWRSHTCG